MKYGLGIDAGGTYTDAFIVREDGLLWNTLVIPDFQLKIIK